MKYRNMNRAWVLLLVPLLVGLLGCPFSPDKKDDPDPPPPSEFKSQVSITNVLYNLDLAYTEMDYDEYAKLLDPAFTFVFDPDDIGPEEPWQEETWGRGEELDSAENMFGGQPNIDNRAVDRIELDFVAGQPETSPINDEWQMVILNAVDLALHTTDVGSGDQWLLQTPGNYFANIHFVTTDEIDSETDLPIINIVMWEDRPPDIGKFIAQKQ